MIVYLIVWGIMLAASQLVRTDGHVRPDLVLRAVPPRVQRWMEVLNCIAALVFCVGLVWYGWSIVATSWQLDERSSSDLQFPMWIYYAALVLFCSNYLEHRGRLAIFRVVAWVLLFGNPSCCVIAPVCVMSPVKDSSI